ncbi:MAG: phosphoribosylglycinamide formyltransferase [Syntrophotaleaceae bacterium]
MNKKLRLAVLASGGGTNLQAIIDRCREGELDAEIVLVISNKPDAGALERARKAGLPEVCLDHRLFSDRLAYDRALIASLRQAEAELVVLAGYMRLLSEEFLQAFPNRILNIHPALLPAFPGIRAQRQALEYGVRVAGCTVHFLDSGVDTGPIVLQAAVPVLEGDSEESLSQRILREEHRIYPQAIQLYAEGRLHIEGRRVRIAPPLAAENHSRPGA